MRHAKATGSAAHFRATFFVEIGRREADVEYAAIPPGHIDHRRKYASTVVVRQLKRCARQPVPQDPGCAGNDVGIEAEMSGMPTSILKR